MLYIVLARYVGWFFSHLSIKLIDLDAFLEWGISYGYCHIRVRSSNRSRSESGCTSIKRGRKISTFLLDDWNF